MTRRPLKSILGSRVRKLRLDRGLTQEQMAELLEVTPRYYAGLDRGERNLSLDSIDSLADQLGVDAVALLLDLEAERPGETRPVKSE